MTKRVSVIVGSLRRESFARKIAKHVMELFPAGYEPEIVEIRDLPLYDCDYDDPAVADKPAPAEYQAFREQIRNSAGVLFVTAENNRTMPACIKNVVDIGSKPADSSVWKGLPCAIMSHSVGTMGGYSSQKTLKLALSYFEMPMVGMPEVFIPKSHDLVGEDGRIKSERTVKFLADYVEKFCKVMDAHPRG